MCVSNDDVVSAARSPISMNINRNLMNGRHVDRAMHTFEIILSCHATSSFCGLWLENRRKKQKKINFKIKTRDTNFYV